MLSIANETDLNIANGLYVIKFWAPWCGPCKMYGPVIDKLEAEYTDFEFISIDTDQAPELARKYKISSLPTLIFIQDGEEKKRVVGLSLIKPLRAIMTDLSKDYKDNLVEDSVKTGTSCA